MLRTIVFAIGFAAACASNVWAADLREVQALFQAGKYDEATLLASEQVEGGIWNENWPRLLLECRLAQGKYAEAVEDYEAAIDRYPTSLTLRMLGLNAYRYAGKTDEATLAKADIMRLLQSAPSRFASRDNLVAAGRYFAMRGEDARQILEFFYDRVRDADPNFLEAYLATAELALEKGDFKVAAETLQRAELLSDTDPRIPSLSAKAWAPSDSAKATEFLEEALKRNPNHVPSLIDRAEAEINAEQYDEAKATIRQVLAVNLHEPKAWSLLAVLAHLDGNFEIEGLMRAAALSTWSDNPEVDHLIGRKLSEKYRFAEGAQYQRRAIVADPRFQAASFQLAQDLLRLGEDATGYVLAEEVSRDDPYNVVAHNLMTLSDRVKGFTRIESDGIEIRMEPKEASIYGAAVMDLLREAKLVLCEKYDVQPTHPIVVEIFPEQNDFAIRTFGLPGGAGYLGVCFGRVITANSPASQGATPSNWKSVLWHEFCHVVTLEKTRNRMPRWLSEGISVYEERQRDPSWGESMSPTYREMLLGEELTPVSRLSGAFLSPKSALHLQFAYFESSLVVEFLVEKYGMDSLLATLDDLADGLSIDDALAGNVGSAQKLDQQFADYAHELAKQFGSQWKWDKLEVEGGATSEQLQTWIKENPDNYWSMMSQAKAEVATKQWKAALSILESICDSGAVTGQSDGPLAMLASVYRQLDDQAKERQTLTRITELSSDAIIPLGRLIEIARQKEDWNALLRHGEQFLAIQPLIVTGHDAVVEASEHLDEPQRAIESLKSLAMMEPVDPAAIDYRAAVALAKLNRRAEAKRHVLKALEEAPRYRDAHRLLFELKSADSEKTESVKSE